MEQKLLLLLKIFDVGLVPKRRIILKLLILLFQVFQIFPMKRFPNENGLDPPVIHAGKGMSKKVSNYMQYI